VTIETRAATSRGVADAQDVEFTRLYTGECDRMRRLAYLMTGQSAVAEEIVHDAFLRVHDRWQDIDTPAGYLRTTVVNLCRAWGNRVVMARERTPRSGGSVDPPELDETWDLLARLPHDQRVVLVLRYYEDLSDGDIAAFMGCKPATVRTRIHRALRKLRKEMTP
jgi:RNA polymerase sigma factor (sigma-70 family)